MDNIQYSFKPLGPWSNTEIHPVKEHDDHCEQCEPADADFYSVYIRYAADVDGIAGLDCIGDFMTEEQAQAFADFLNVMSITRELE